MFILTTFLPVYGYELKLKCSLELVYIHVCVLKYTICISTEAPLPLQTVGAGTGMGSVSISGNANALPGFPTQFAGSHTLSKVHRPVLRADAPHLHTPGRLSLTCTCI